MASRKPNIHVAQGFWTKHAAWVAVLIMLAATASALPTLPEEGKLTVSDASSGQFGGAVAVSGDTAVIGAEGSGNAYVFTRSGGTWTEQAKLVASDGALSDRYGWAVAVDGDTAVIGAYQDSATAKWAGAAYVFTRSGAAWTEEAKLIAGDGAEGDFFGWAVAVSGDTALIGADRDDDEGTNSGSAYVFTRDGTTWTQQAKLTAADGSGGDNFGVSVAMDGDTAVIGASSDRDNGINSGSAYVFTRSGSSWTQQAKLTASDGSVGAQLGISAAMIGGTALIGASQDGATAQFAGAAYVFTRNGASWTEEAKLTASDTAGGENFGVSVSLSEDTAVVGAYQDDDLGSDSGSAYVFTRSATTWSEEAKLTASDGAPGDRFGSAVAVAVDSVLVGVPDASSVYVFGSNDAPVAVIASVPDAECTDGAATVTVDGGGSFDPDGDAFTYAWSGPGISFDDAASATPTASFPVGSTIVTLVVTDAYGAEGTANAEVNVVDTLAPDVVVTRPVSGTAYVDDEEVPHGVTDAPIVVSGPLTIIAHATDQCGVAEVNFASNAGLSGSDEAAPYTFVHNPGPLASGDVTVGVTAVDLGGQTAGVSVGFAQLGTAI